MLIPESQLAACRRGMVAIGNFDGVHRGHQRMARVLTQQADQAGVPSVVMTFDPPPAALLRPDRVPPSLTTPEQRARLLLGYGVDEVLIWPTTLSLLQLTPEAFFNEILLGRLSASGLVEGPNFQFGKDRTGDVEVLKEFCAVAGIELTIVTPVVEAGQLISSSRIRDLIVRGGLAEAVDLLGHPFRLSGEVVTGAGRGSTALGFPTANLDSIPTLVPAEGVYAGFCEIDGQEYECAVNVGQNPTFDEGTRKVEVHVIGWTGDLYGRLFDVDLVAGIREVRAFRSAEALKEQIQKDVESALRLCARYRARQ